MRKTKVEISAIKMSQPMGEFYVGVMRHSDLSDISFVDMRRIERDLDDYIGIQRKLNEKRVSEISEFVNTIDAAFPTSVVLAVPGKCADYDERTKTLSLFENLDRDDGDAGVPYAEIAKVLDGQHRIEGLRGYEGENFDVPVTIFVNADIADQAYIFATVNLAQTKVNKSLVYDLLDYSRSRSPQKSCHEIAVALNRHVNSPFRNMIKRLGSATPGVSGETLTQATFVTTLLPMISDNPVKDRDLALRGKKLPYDKERSSQKTPFRKIFIEERDYVIAKNISEFFSAVSERWPSDWLGRDKGNILPRTNGFKAFMRIFKDVYLVLVNEQGGEVFDRDQYRCFIDKFEIPVGGFNSEVYKPGTSGETKLYDHLKSFLQARE